MSTDVHFEVYVKTNRKTSWQLDQALSSRHDALKIAKERLAELPKGSVRVTKESFDDAQNTFLTIPIFEEGEERHVRKISADNKIEPSCVSPDDLYAMHARRTLGRALGPWLKQNGICVLELLHHSHSAEKLAAAGHDRQHAIQKVSIAQAGALECSVQHLVRRLTELADAATDQLRRAEKQKRTAKFDDRGFAVTLQKISKFKEPGFALCTALASRMAKLKSWPAKISFLAGCASDALVEVGDDEKAFSTLDSFLAEITSLPHAIDACVNGDELGDKLDQITDILCGKAPASASDSAQLLALAISSGKLPQTQSALSSRIFRELRGPRRLYPDRFEDEVLLNSSLADRLVHLPNALIVPEQLSEAFSIRSSRLLDANSIQRLLSTAKNPGAEILKLINFEQNMIGAQNKRKLAGFVRAIICAHKTEIWFCKSGPNIFQALSVCGRAQKWVTKGGFCKEDKHEINMALDRLCFNALQKNNALDTIERRESSGVQKAISLLKLPEQGLLTIGQCSNEASRRAMNILRTTEARADLAQNRAGEANELSALLKRTKAQAI